MNEKRLVVALFGVILASVILYIGYRFIAPLTVAFFLYYSTRKFHRGLARFRIPVRIRAAMTLSLLGIPLVVLLAYTLLLMIIEIRQFIEDNPFVWEAAEDFGPLADIDEMPELTIDGLIGAYQSGDFDPFVEFLFEHGAAITDLIAASLLNLLIIAVVTYYLLTEGHKARSWLEAFDDEAIAKGYFEAADKELEEVLFGNLLNVIAIAIIAIVAYMGYNAVAPTAAEVPYPALAGALTGIASLIPVVGMKIVYVPLAGAAALPIILDGGDPLMLAYIGVFLAVAVVIVDTIPDLLLRPYLSGEQTHVGLLLLAYIFGPIVFGFYGLFLAPIILVLGLTFAQTALPRLLGDERKPIERMPDDQRTLDDF